MIVNIHSLPQQPRDHKKQKKAVGEDEDNDDRLDIDSILISHVK